MASIQKRGKSYLVTASLGYDSRGRQRRKTTTYTPPPNVTPGKAEKLARQYAAVWESKLKDNPDLNESITFAELCDWYFTNIAPHTLRKNTMEGRQRTIELYLLEPLGSLQLKKITPAKLDVIFTSIYNTGGTHRRYKLKDQQLLVPAARETVCQKAKISEPKWYGVRGGQLIYRDTANRIAAALGRRTEDAFECVDEPGVSAIYVRRIAAMLSSIFQAAVDKGIVQQNPVKRVTLPKVEPKPPQYLDVEQVHQLLNELHRQPDYRYEMLFVFLLATGLRIGEALALWWDDIDLDRGIVSVKYTLIRQDGQFIRSQPKTASSLRNVAIGSSMISAMRDYKARQDEDKAVLGDAWAVPSGVFVDELGRYRYKGDVNRRLKSICASAGLPQIHTHTLRHTAASVLINDGQLPTQAISQRLGHSSARTTENVYSHIFRSTEQQAAAVADSYLFETNDEKETEHK